MSNINDRIHTKDIGIDFDIDKVEKEMPARPGSHYVGDIQNTDFIPVGFRDYSGVRHVKVAPRSVSKPRVEFSESNNFIKDFVGILYFISNMENKAFTFFGNFGRASIKKGGSERNCFVSNIFLHIRQKRKKFLLKTKKNFYSFLHYFKF